MNNFLSKKTISLCQKTKKMLLIKTVINNKMPHLNICVIKKKLWNKLKVQFSNFKINLDPPFNFNAIERKLKFRQQFILNLSIFYWEKHFFIKSILYLKLYNRSSFFMKKKHDDNVNSSNSIPPMFQYVWVGGEIRPEYLSTILKISAAAFRSGFEETIIWTDNDEYINEPLRRSDLKSLANKYNSSRKKILQLKICIINQLTNPIQNCLCLQKL